MPAMLTRLDADLHELLKLAAWSSRRSLNALVVDALREYLRKHRMTRTAMARFLRRIENPRRGGRK